MLLALSTGRKLNKYCVDQYWTIHILGRHIDKVLAGEDNKASITLIMGYEYIRMIIANTL